jgi:hypothetical protein
MTVVVESFDYTPSFRDELGAAPADCQSAARHALKQLKLNPRAKTLRLHALSGYKKPTIYKIDVFTNHSWQITFELEGTKAILRRLAPHRDIDRRPR